MTKPVRIYILYGFREGPHSGRRLLPRLRAAGFEPTSDVQSADIILSHSGGCFLAPNNLAAQPPIVMVGLPYWPGKSTARSLLEKNRVEFWEYSHKHQS